jgi:hypothetical protein
LMFTGKNIMTTRCTRLDKFGIFYQVIQFKNKPGNFNSSRYHFFHDKYKYVLTPQWTKLYLVCLHWMWKTKILSTSSVVSLRTIVVLNAN